MSGDQKQTSRKFIAESQQQRWFKYGANVAVSTIVVAALAVVIVYLAEKPRFDKRIDATSSGSYSLKPQTKNLLRDLKSKVKLVSLYAAKDAQDKDNPTAGQVRDLLDEYARSGSNVEVDSIDPIKQPTKTDALINDALLRYGGAVNAYKKFIDDYLATTHEKLKTMADAESTALGSISADSFGQDDASQQAATIADALRDQLPKQLATLKSRTEKSLKTKFPDYKAIVDRISDAMDTLNKNETTIVGYSDKQKSNARLPDAFREYLSKSTERNQAIATLADQTSKTIASLGELKVGELQSAIKGQDLVLVLGPAQWRVVNSDQIFINDARDYHGYSEGQKLKPRFAGEQAITSAVLAVTQETKSKVAFVRAGGSPLTSPGFPPFSRGGPLSDVADRLRSNNFEVLEKDLTGQYAMQQQMQGGGMEGPEASDDAIRNAVWIVIDSSTNDPRTGQPGPSIDAKVAEHLRSGGSALILASPQADTLNESLKDFGLSMPTDTVVVHEVPKGGRPRGGSGDLGEEAQWLPFVFLLNDYGDQSFAAPLRSLDSIFVGVVPIKSTPTPGVKYTPVLPIPQVTKIWGETDIQSATAGGDGPTFDPKVDLPPPLFAGAQVEKGETRLVVMGSWQGFMNQILSYPDEEMRRRGLIAPRFPGEAELFSNAVFWLAKMDTMIAISPQALEVSRISAMSEASLKFWRVGVMLVALPGLVLAAGLWVFVARRD